MIVPDGSGDALESAFLPNGDPVNGTVIVILRDGAGVAYENYCRHNIELRDLAENLSFCEGGNWADAHTDANGVTHFSGPLMGGGHSQTNLMVFVMNTALTSSSGVRVHINSTDLNGDLQVDLSDVAIFAGDFFVEGYQYRSDFHRDGVVNLSDVTRMAQSIGASCQ